MRPEPASPHDESPGAAPSREVGRTPRWLEPALDRWRAVAVAVLWLLIPVVVVGRLDLGWIEIGGKSFTRNAALLLLVGGALGVRGMRLQRSRLTAPLLAYLAVAWFSVLWNRGVPGEARLLAWTVALFFGVRSLTEANDGRGMLLYWLGAFSLADVLGEIAANPELLAFSPAHRTELRWMHANTLGGSLALVLPIFLAAAIDGGRRVAGGWSVAIALLGILLSFSRSALLCALVGVAAYALLRQDRPRLRGGVPLFAAALVAALGAVASLSLERSEADLQRLRILRTSLVLFSEHWPLGVGFGIENLRRLFPARYIELYGSSLFLFHSHNMYVEFLVGTGVLGAVAGAWLLARLVSVAAARRRAATTAEERGLAAGYAGSLVVLFLMGLTDSPFYHAELLVMLPVVWALTELSAAPAAPAQSAPRRAVAALGARPPRRP